MRLGGLNELCGLWNDVITKQRNVDLMRLMLQIFCDIIFLIVICVIMCTFNSFILNTAQYSIV
jgi:hypothetical protein